MLSCKTRSSADALRHKSPVVLIVDIPQKAPQYTLTPHSKSVGLSSSPSLLTPFLAAEAQQLAAGVSGLVLQIQSTDKGAGFRN